MTLEQQHENLNKVIRGLYCMVDPYIPGIVTRKFDYKKIKEALNTALVLVDNIEATHEAIFLRECISKENEDEI